MKEYKYDETYFIAQVFDLKNVKYYVTHEDESDIIHCSTDDDKLYVKYIVNGNGFIAKSSKVAEIPKHKMERALKMINCLNQEQPYLKFILEKSGYVYIMYEFQFKCDSYIGDVAYKIYINFLCAFNENFERLFRNEEVIHPKRTIVNEECTVKDLHLKSDDTIQVRMGATYDLLSGTNIITKMLDENKVVFCTRDTGTKEKPANLIFCFHEGFGPIVNFIVFGEKKGVHARALELLKSCPEFKVGKVLAACNLINQVESGIKLVVDDMGNVNIEYGILSESEESIGEIGFSVFNHFIQVMRDITNFLFMVIIRHSEEYESIEEDFIKEYEEKSSAGEVFIKDLSDEELVARANLINLLAEY